MRVASMIPTPPSTAATTRTSRAGPGAPAGTGLLGTGSRHARQGPQPRTWSASWPVLRVEHRTLGRSARGLVPHHQRRYRPRSSSLVATRFSPCAEVRNSTIVSYLSPAHRVAAITITSTARSHARVLMCSSVTWGTTITGMCEWRVQYWLVDPTNVRLSTPLCSVPTTRN